MITLTLPWPPTVNHYYAPKAPRGDGRLFRGYYVDERGLEFRKAVADCVVEQLRRIPRISERVRVTYTCSPPDLRVRDLSNILKATEDALTHAGVWNDDGQIDDFRMIRDLPKKGGQVMVQVEPIGE